MSYLPFHEEEPFSLVSFAITVGQVLAGLGVIVGAWFKMSPKIKNLALLRKQKIAKAQVLQNARILRLVGLLIREWRIKLGAQRILLLYAKNGGKPWRPEEKIKVSCLDQVTEKGEENTWGRWQDWHVDPSYREILTDLLVSEQTDRGILLITDNMPDGVLKDAYKSQGTIASIVIPIFWLPSENGLVYASINFGKHLEDGETLSKEAKNSYEQQARKLFGDPELIRKKIVSARQIWQYPIKI